MRLCLLPIGGAFIQIHCLTVPDFEGRGMTYSTADMLYAVHLFGTVYSLHLTGLPQSYQENILYEYVTMSDPRGFLALLLHRRMSMLICSLFVAPLFGWHLYPSSAHLAIYHDRW